MKHKTTKSRPRVMMYDFALNKRQFDINSPMYENPEDLRYDKEEEMRTAKEIADYEALPEKARHPYGGECPDFSDRISNRPWKDPHYGDKLAKKRPNSIADIGRAKRELNDLYEESVKNLPFILEYIGDKYGDYRRFSKEQIICAYEQYLDKIHDNYDVVK